MLSTRLHDFQSALRFLTVLRIPGWPERPFSMEHLAAGFPCFPLVGAALGLILATVTVLFGSFVPPLLLAACLTALLTLLTRGFHLDGLADLSDGVGGGATPERRLEIMKDSRTGAFGATAIALALLLKTAAFASLVAGDRLGFIVLAPVLARFAMVLAAHGSVYARERGLGKPFLEHMRPAHLKSAAFVAVGLALVLARAWAVPFMAVAVAVPLALRALSRRWLGGITGDVLGAVNEVTETLLLALGACIVYSLRY